MKNLDLDFNLKYVFLILHVAFLAGGAFYMALGQQKTALIFIVSSVMALNYFLVYLTEILQRRNTAEVRMLEQKLAGETQQIPETGEEEDSEDDSPSLKEVLQDRNLEESKEFIDEHFEEEDNKKGFLKAVKEAEEEGKDRLGVKNHANEKLLELTEA